jgi:trk system potassium uptake protein
LILNRSLGDNATITLKLRRSLLFSKWEIHGRHRLSIWDRITPPQLFVLSFLLLVLFGTVGLKVLPGVYTGEPLSWLDACFTATSAVCVTGLVVVDTATYFTTRGQAFILLLIQLGGLGIIIFTSLIIIALGRRLSLRQEALSTGTASIAPHVKPGRLLRDVVVFTFLFESLGALLLYSVWFRPYGAVDGLWHAVFHAVSAFCNAGFSTFPNNLIAHDRAPFALSVIMVLIVTGGIGFLTLEELYLRFQAGRRDQIFRISLHSRIVLVVTALLLVGGWILFSLLEWNHVLGHLPWYHRLVNAMFMSVTARTAGFNAIDYGQATDAGNFLTVLLMSIGGSPGSTAGGLKTTTIALIGLLAWSRMCGREIVSLQSRSVPEETIQRAVGLFVVCFGVVTAAIFIIVSSQGGAPGTGNFLHCMFEAASAFNTVGLTMGLTNHITPTTEWTLIFLMFIGRVGPLAFAAALALARPTGDKEFRYAYEDVVVG